MAAAEGHPGPLVDRDEAQAPRHAPRARAAGDRPDNVLADRPEIRGMIARVPHLVEWRRCHEAPRPRPAEGLHAREASRRPRHRRQGRQDRRPWDQGPEGAHPDPRGVRGWPAADPRARPQAARLHEPVPRELHPREPRGHRRPRARRGRARRARGARPRAQGRAREGARRAADLAARSASRPTASRRPPRAAIEAAGGSTDLVALPFGNGRPPARGNQHTNR